ncbi:FKBP-type peptidyl-prolyl cis-trans isomerase [Bacteroides thetaiotaomicron]|nr:FKBP-type peptidyl-prolyl cis-trans isomerase [Bacteroides thetaiotaomicron]MCS2997811.1 FKBP-type peptidyl-prolyl cis-trans isomerase [Bacteroides thetaiotaomicron]
MKKVSIFMAIAAAASLASCTAQAPKANLKTDIDSLSYSIGMAQTQGLKGYLTGRLDVDTAYMAEFIKGLNEGANKTSKKDIAYMAGLQIGQQISNQMMKGINQELFAGDSTKTISKDNFMAGFIAGTLEKGGVMTMEAAQEYTRTAMETIKAKAMETIKAKAMEEKYADNKAAGEKFLAENKTKEGVKTTESGLQYKVITEGKGEIPADTCKVKVNYKGTLIDGTEFDSSYKRNEPATFRANQVIKGWTEALTMMPVGSKWELYIPQELAYGSRESGQIKPFSTLIFEVELVGIEKDKK